MWTIISLFPSWETLNSTLHMMPSCLPNKCTYSSYGTRLGYHTKKQSRFWVPVSRSLGLMLTQMPWLWLCLNWKRLNLSMHALLLQCVVHTKPQGNFSACKGGLTRRWMFSHTCAWHCANLITRSQGKLSQMPQFGLATAWGWNCNGSLHMLRVLMESTCSNMSNGPLTTG